LLRPGKIQDSGKHQETEPTQDDADTDGSEQKAIA
jgi:hypothetical protein